MQKKTLARVATAAVLCLGLAACGDDAADSTATPGASAGGDSPSEGGSVGVILPDASTSPRWEANDRPLLAAAFETAGVEADIQNADGTPPRPAPSATARSTLPSTSC